SLGRLLYEVRVVHLHSYNLFIYWSRHYLIISSTILSVDFQIGSIACLIYGRGGTYPPVLVPCPNSIILATLTPASGCALFFHAISETLSLVVISDVHPAAVSPVSLCVASASACSPALAI